MLVLGGASLWLDDDRDVCASFVAPALEALEAIKELETLTVDSDDTKRQIREWIGAHGQHARPQTSITCRNLIDGHDADGAGASISTMSRSRRT